MAGFEKNLEMDDNRRQLNFAANGLTTVNRVLIFAQVDQME